MAEREKAFLQYADLRDRAHMEATPADQTMVHRSPEYTLPQHQEASDKLGEREIAINA